MACGASLARLVRMAGARGTAESAADIDGWIRSALEPLESPDDDRGGNTEVGSASVARALISIRGRTRIEDDAQESIPTAPPPPHSDIRRIGSTMSDPHEDPLAVHAGALRLPAVEIEPRTLAPPRMRRETMKLPPPMRPRQATLLMPDRPSALTPATPPMALTPSRRPSPEPRGAIAPPPPSPLRGSVPLLVFAFAIGILLSGIVAFTLARI